MLATCVKDELCGAQWASTEWSTVETMGGNMCVGVNEVKPEVVLDCQAVVLSPYGRPLINHAIWLLEYTATLLTNRSFISQEKQDFLP